MNSGPTSHRVATLTRAIALLLVLGSNHGFAQRATDPVAIQLKNQGDQSIEASRFDDALNAYTKALSIEPTSALHYNRGRALQALGRNAEALEEFETFQGSASDELKAAVPELGEMVRLVRSQIAEVVVTCDTPAASLHVRGKVLSLPLRQPLRFDPATIVFEVAAAGYESWRTRMTLAAGETRDLEPTLRRRDLRATLTITSAVLGAQVRVDGQEAGTVPAELRLAPGVHAIELEHPAFRSANSSVVLRSGERRSIEIGLDPIPRWYERWWFWAGVGAVVTTGVVVGVALSTERGPDNGDIPPGRITSSLVAW